MIDRFTMSLGFVFRWECVYAAGHEYDSAFVVSENVPGDGGGVTKWGIDAADHPGIDIENLTLEEATTIYHDGEWTAIQGDTLPAGIDTAVFDEAVNTGVRESVILLQRALYGLGYRLAVDGALGPATMAAVVKQAQIDSAGLISQLLAMRRQYYQEIVADRPGDAGFLQGWLNRVNDLAAFLKGGAV